LKKRGMCKFLVPYMVRTHAQDVEVVTVIYIVHQYLTK